MTTSSPSVNTASSGQTPQRPPFRWLNPLQFSVFRLIVGLGIGAIVLVLINAVVAGPLGTGAYAWSVLAAVVAYLLAEVMIVMIASVGPLVGFVYGLIAYFSR